jgi:hypothetical protein
MSELRYSTVLLERERRCRCGGAVHLEVDKGRVVEDEYRGEERIYFGEMTDCEPE